MGATEYQISMRKATSDIWRKLCKIICLCIIGDFNYPNIYEKDNGIGASNTDDSELTRQIKFLGHVVCYPTGPQVPSVPS